jgi:Prokaryotic N-terminal methylation motif
MYKFLSKENKESIIHIFKNRRELKFQHHKKSDGFTLVEVVVSLLVSLMLVLGIYSLVIYSLHITADNKYYVEAIEIANQKMEQVRNLSYSDVGTQAGSPTGVILDYEYDVRDKFTVYTTVQFYDDPYDGTLEGADDDIFVDYKIATIKVSWSGNFGDKNVTVFSKIIPVTEETLEGYGLLKIIVVDADGEPFPNANVHVENNVLDPAMNADYSTDLNGILSLAVLPEFESYEVSVTKEGNGIDKTYDRDLVNLNPSKPHLSVTEGLKTEQGFSIDFLSSLTIRTVDQELPDNWQVNTDAGLDVQSGANLTIDNNGFVYLVWEDFRSASASKVYAQKYNYSGEQQWTPDDIVIATANNQVNPFVLSDVNNNSYIAWNDDSVGNQDVYLIQIDPSGGDSWGGAQKVSVLDGAADQANPKLALFSTGTSTALVFEDDRNTDIDLYLQRYDEDGNQLWFPEVRVNKTTILDSTDQYSPSMAIDSTDNIYIAWTDNRNGDTDIYAQKYNSSGTALWGSDLKVNINSDSTDQYSPSMAIDSTDNIYIAWTDNRNGDTDIYAQKYNSSGTALWGSDLKVNINSDSTDQYSPSMAIDSTDNIYIAWTDNRNGDTDIYAQNYDTSGLNLWDPDLRVNIDMSEFNQYDVYLAINPSTDEVLAVWTDERNGNPDIYVSRFDYYEAPSYLSNIPLTLVGTKQIGDDPIIYEHNEDYLTDGSGLVNINLEWDTGYLISLQEGYEDYEIIFTNLVQPFEILPGMSEEILLYLKP